MAKMADESLRSVVYPHGLGVEIKTV